jgi:hypothetical protein
VYELGLCLDTYLLIDRLATLSQRLGYRVKAYNSTGCNVCVGTIFSENTFTFWHKIIFPLCLNGISLHQLKSLLLHYLLSTRLRGLALGRLDFEGGSGDFI